MISNELQRKWQNENTGHTVDYATLQGCGGQDMERDTRMAVQGKIDDRGWQQIDMAIGR